MIFILVEDKHCKSVMQPLSFSRLMPGWGVRYNDRRHFVFVSVPPDILDYPTSTDMVVREGSNVTMRCAASGSPTPNITWRREGGETIPVSTGQEGNTIFTGFRIF